MGASLAVSRGEENCGDWPGRRAGSNQAQRTAAARTRSRGIHRLADVPSPSALAISMSPPCAFRISLESARPRPTPSEDRTKGRSEERRVGKGCVSRCSSRWERYHKKKKKKK